MFLYVVYTRTPVLQYVYQTVPGMHTKKYEGCMVYRYARYALVELQYKYAYLLVRSLR